MANIREEILQASDAERKRTGEYDARPDPRFTDSELAEIEQECGAKLPQGYRSFVKQYGDLGFELGEWSKIKVGFEVAGKTVIREAVLSHLNNKKRILEERKRYAFDHEYYDEIGPRIPPDMLPIGRALLTRDGLLLLNLGENNNGSIWLWDGPDETWGTGENRFIGYIAPSVDDMMSLIEYGDPS